jgi:hypothetical protein
MSGQRSGQRPVQVWPMSGLFILARTIKDLYIIIIKKARKLKKHYFHIF